MDMLKKGCEFQQGNKIPLDSMMVYLKRITRELRVDRKQVTRYINEPIIR